jgi:DNA-binding IclR family transcriptional regulator
MMFNMRTITPEVRMPSAQAGNKTIHKVLSLLEAFSPQDPWLSITELAAILDLPRVSMYRMITPLLEKNYLQFDSQTKRYAPGVAFFRLGQIALRTMHFSRGLPIVLDTIAARIPHTITVGIARERKLIYIDKRESNTGLKFGADIGATLPIYHGSGGKIFLSHMSPEEAAEILDAARQDPGCILSRETLDKLQKELPAIRQQGYLIWPGETQQGLMSIAAPIFNHNGSMEAAMTFLIPAALATDEELERCRGILVEACNTLSMD